MKHLFKTLSDKFTGMTKPYPEGKLFGSSVDEVVETFKRARTLTRKYGANVLFLNELDLLEDKTGETMPKNEWTSDWPTKPGWYWFYGQKYGEVERSMSTIRVRRAMNGVYRVIDGHFMYQQEGHRGMFQRIPTPVVPTEIAGGKL